MTNEAPRPDGNAQPSGPENDATQSIEQPPLEAPEAGADDTTAQLPTAPPEVPGPPPIQPVEPVPATAVEAPPVLAPAPGLTPVAAPVAAAAPRAKDRLWIHFVWEGVLLLVLLALAGTWIAFADEPLFKSMDAAAFQLFAQMPYLLIAMAIAVSLRTGTINLAASFLAFLAPALFAYFSHQGDLLAWGVTVGATVLAGVLIAGFVTVLRTAPWAASLAVAAVAMFVAGATMETVRPDGELASLPLAYGAAWLIIGGIVVLSIVGGALGMIPPLRKTLAASRDAATGDGKRSVGTFLTTWLALLVSVILAAAAGMLSLVDLGGQGGTFFFSLQGVHPLFIALGIVLLGGTSARTGRGGVLGTVLAAGVVYLSIRWLLYFDLNEVANYWVPVGALFLGLLVGWLVDLCGRGRAATAPLVPAVAPEVAPMPEPGVDILGRPPVAAPPTEQQYWPAQETQTIQVEDDNPPPPQSDNPYLYRPPAQ